MQFRSQLKHTLHFAIILL